MGHAGFLSINRIIQLQSLDPQVQTFDGYSRGASNEVEGQHLQKGRGALS